MHLTTLLTALPLTLALHYRDLSSRQSSFDPSNQSVGNLRTVAPAGDRSIVGTAVYDPANIYDPHLLAALSPSTSNDAMGLDYSVREGKLRGRSIYGAEIWFLMPETTGYINITNDATTASTGFTYGTDNLLKYEGDATSWWACTGLQRSGFFLLYVDIDGIAPTAGTCTAVSLNGTVPAR